MADTQRPTTRELVLVPALITLAITILRLVGELQGWSPRLFNRAAGGGGALVGISWLPFVFGPYFAWRLGTTGDLPARLGRAFGMALLGLGIVAATAVLANVAGVPPLAAVGLVSVIALLGGWVAARGWPSLGRTLLVYALAARVPVAALMLPAILGNWGTHYDAPPPGFPPMGPIARWAITGLLPQLTLWIGFTLIMGMLFGAIAAAVLRTRRRQVVATAA